MTYRKKISSLSSAINTCERTPISPSYTNFAIKEASASSTREKRIQNYFIMDPDCVVKAEIFFQHITSIDSCSLRQNLRSLGFASIRRMLLRSTDEPGKPTRNQSTDVENRPKNMKEKNHE